MFFMDMFRLSPDNAGYHMKKRITISITWLIVAVAAAVILGAYAIAAHMASVRIREIEWLSGLPSAFPDTAEGLPARYAGRLYGPEGRITPLGQRAAAYWWTVSSRDADVGYDVKCRGRARTGLILETAGGKIPIAWTEADPDDVGIASDTFDGDYGLHLAIDVGGIPSVRYDEVPPGTCQYGENYLQTYIGQGAQVEAVGCMRNGAIDRCDALIEGVLSAPDIKSDMRHRLRSAMHGFFYAAYLGLWLLFLSTLALWKLMKRDVKSIWTAGKKSEGVNGV